MSSTVEINGKKLHSIKEAAQSSPYSRDYITRLAREGKIIASNINRQWFIAVDSLQSYAEASAFESEIRKKQLSAERKQERQLRQATEQQKERRHARARTLHVRSVVAACAVLGIGLASGSATYQLLLPVSENSATQTAQLPAAENTPDDNLAADSDTEAAAEAKRVSVQSLGEVEAGVLLLPNASTTVEALFSDPVQVERRPDGTDVVRRVDRAGQPIGNEVPYVWVPVEDNRIGL